MRRGDIYANLKRAMDAGKIELTTTRMDVVSHIMNWEPTDKIIRDLEEKEFEVEQLKHERTPLWLPLEEDTKPKFVFKRVV